MLQQPLRIAHVLRAPVGGLFRHVRDLSRAQAAAGHHVGVICDSRAADLLTEVRLDDLKSSLGLGLVRLPMNRDIGLSDILAHRRIAAILADLEIDVVHGHGAKGGAYARLAGRRLQRAGKSIDVFYTPHGGSLHYSEASLVGSVYMLLERSLAPLTDGIIFESRFSADRFRTQVRREARAIRIVPNGLLPDEFYDHKPNADARDVLFVGELRYLKGVDVLLRALGHVAHRRPITALIVGDGPDADEFKALAASLGLRDRVSFPGARPARQVFADGRLLVVPSRAESFPYIVLEAAAAGLPMIATDVGGIGEIVEGTDIKLVPPGNETALSDAILSALNTSAATANATQALKLAVARRFTVEKMTRDIEEFYRSARAR